MENGRVTGRIIQHAARRSPPPREARHGMEFDMEFDMVGSYIITAGALLGHLED